MSKKIMRNLMSLPGVITELGLGVAEAQRNFNLDYLSDMEDMLSMVSEAGKKINGSNEEDGLPAVLEGMIPAMAPTRYQFTETTFSMKMDISQSLKIGAAVGFNIGIVQAAASATYGSNYRAAAEVRTVLHAVPMDKTVLNTLLGRARELGDKDIEMPVNAEVNVELSNQASAILEKLTAEPKKDNKDPKKEEK